MHKLILAIVAVMTLALPASAQDLRVATVTRAPFSLEQDGVQTGFSLDLWAALMEDMSRGSEVVRVQDFREMLSLVETGQVDAAVANISITADRERVLDFSQPIFEGGLQIMVPAGGSSGSPLLRVLLNSDLLIAILVAFAVLLGVGMMMWRFERRSQEYFDLEARDAMFPAFWWALNLVVNGGFEERVPRSLMGRLFGVVLVVSSLFIVSIFVANITAALTVNAIQGSVNSINDLYGKRVGTTSGSTAAAYLDRRDLRHEGFADLDALLDAFEAGNLDAVVFDAPILAFYVNTDGQGIAELVGSVFLRENYGIALATGSDLAEPLNQSLLRLREDGTYDALRQKWFGVAER
ncbi:transporter substrate-binding domain-containing protein [Aliiroseovarius subalbicans]|uniref:transporter substrate-binding domain-containing protein n=1 Tax=Aliiroseovarius subalbicans TaxID=2925840 RepID=UPI001F55E91F|nr:transporter substrate-binding domain-containing protein [Aliiroseovarius subalbicans]MCI2399875.1 transporter substrate-binding domain-containing protein [Aliiroseovarius subalbicans]